MPGMPAVGNGSASISSGFVRGGGGRDPLVVVRVVGEPHAHAARGRVAQRARHQVARLARQADVVEGQVERLARLAQEGRDAVRDLERRLTARIKRIGLDHCQRKPVGADAQARAGSSGSPSGSCGSLNPRGAVSLGVSGWNSDARYWMWPRPRPSSVWPPP